MTINFKYTKEVIVTIILLVLLIVAWSFFLSPQYTQFSQSKASAGAVLDQLSGLEQEITEIENLSSSLDRVQQVDVDKIGKMLPYGQNLEDMLANMHKLGQQSGMLITSLYVHPIEEDASSVSDAATDPTALIPDAATEPMAIAPKQLQLTMSMRGNYTDLQTFLGLLERHARLIDIETIGVSSTVSNENATESLNVNISARAHYLAEVPKEPMFPFGTQIDLSILDKEQFKLLQTLPGLVPVEGTYSPNPFAPR